MTKQFLDGADVVTVFEQVSSEACRKVCTSIRFVIPSLRVASLVARLTFVSNQ